MIIIINYHGSDDSKWIIVWIVSEKLNYLKCINQSSMEECNYGSKIIGEYKKKGNKN